MLRPRRRSGTSVLGHCCWYDPWWAGRVWRLRLLGGDFLNGLRHELQSRFTCPSGYMFGRHEFACRSSRLSKWIVIARQRWRLSSFSSRGLTRHWTLPRTNPRDSPGPRSGSRPGPAPVEKHETGPISYLIEYVDRRGRPPSHPRSSRVPLISSSTIEYMRLSDRVPMYRTVTSGPERT
jgi:hypothetical protein